MVAKLASTKEANNNPEYVLRNTAIQSVGGSAIAVKTFYIRTSSLLQES